MNKSLLLNSILGQWLNVPQAAAPLLDCDICTKSLASEHSVRWSQFKCCTFQPYIPNFALGKWLAEGGELPNLKFDHSWRPLGLVPGLAYREMYLKTADEERGADLLCAFYDSAHRRCTIWSARPSECSTFFCKGKTKVIEQISRAGFEAETSFAQMALLALNFDEADVWAQVDLLNFENVEGPPPLTRQNAQELYLQSWEWARNLTPEEVRECLEEI